MEKKKRRQYMVEEKLRILEEAREGMREALKGKRRGRGPKDRDRRFKGPLKGGGKVGCGLWPGKQPESG